MAKELKIWLDDEQPVVAKLKSLGGKYAGATDSVHTYFQRPEGQVLKLVRTGGKATLDKLERQGEQFVLVSREPVKDHEALARELTAKHGIRARLVMHAESYRLNDYEVSLYSIEGKGRFLILTGDDPTVDLLGRWLGIRKPKIVTVSFDNL